MSLHLTVAVSHPNPKPVAAVVFKDDTEISAA
jgi:hypothetical protein